MSEKQATQAEPEVKPAAEEAPEKLSPGMQFLADVGKTIAGKVIEKYSAEDCIGKNAEVAALVHEQVAVGLAKATPEVILELATEFSAKHFRRAVRESAVNAVAETLAEKLGVKADNCHVITVGR